MGLRELKKTLGNMDKTDIIQLVSELYKSIPDAKDYLDIFITGDIKNLAEKYKEEIEKYVYPFGRDMVLREREARKLIRKVRKMNITELNIELDLHYVGCCLEVIQNFGYCDENYYIAIEKSFDNAVMDIEKAGVKNRYRKTLSRLAGIAASYGMELEC